MKRDRCRGCLALLGDLRESGDSGELVRGLCTKCRRRKDRARKVKKFASKKAKQTLDRSKHGVPGDGRPDSRERWLRDAT